jgi:hypothetical protein
VPVHRRLDHRLDGDRIGDIGLHDTRDVPAPLDRRSALGGGVAVDVMAYLLRQSR